MPWTGTTRPNYTRGMRRYASNLSDEKWQLIEPLLPPGSTTPLSTKRGRKRTFIYRFDRMSVAHVAKRFPSHVQGSEVLLYLARLWLVANNQPLFGHDDTRKQGREASPTADVINSQSVKTTESSGLRGYDAGKRSKAKSAI